MIGEGVLAIPRHGVQRAQQVKGFAFARDDQHLLDALRVNLDKDKEE